MLCDGRIVCGCADPYGNRVLGDARTESLGAIWNGDVIRRLRTDLNAGGSTFCGDDLAMALDNQAPGGPRRAVHQLALHPLPLERQRPGDEHRAPPGGGAGYRPAVLGDHRPSRERVFRRFAPGTPDHEAVRREIWDDNNLGNAIPGAMPRARIDVRRVPGLPLIGRRARSLTIATQVWNLSTRPFAAQASYGRRLVRLGAQLCDRDGTVVDRDFARAWLPATLEPGARVDVPISIVTPEARGRYALRFDLVSEGIDWFEACGSPTVLEPLLVA